MEIPKCSPSPVADYKKHIACVHNHFIIKQIILEQSSTLIKLLTLFDELDTMHGRSCSETAYTRLQDNLSGNYRRQIFYPYDCFCSMLLWVGITLQHTSYHLCYKGKFLLLNFVGFTLSVCMYYKVEMEVLTQPPVAPPPPPPPLQGASE